MFINRSIVPRLYFFPTVNKKCAANNVELFFVYWMSGGGERASRSNGWGSRGNGKVLHYQNLPKHSSSCTTIDCTVHVSTARALTLYSCRCRPFSPDSRLRAPPPSHKTLIRCRKSGRGCDGAGGFVRRDTQAGEGRGLRAGEDRSRRPRVWLGRVPS